jgi:hypothetical protein
MEDSSPDEISDMLKKWKPFITHLARPFKAFRHHQGRRYLYCKTFLRSWEEEMSSVNPNYVDSIVITDPTHNKKGKFPRTSAKRYTVKHLRNRRIVVFNIEWMKPLANIKREDY